MIITRITDGFGNQLFMYACGYATAKRVGTSLAMDTTILDTNPTRRFELNNLNLQCEKIISLKNIRGKWIKVVYRKMMHRCLRRKYKVYVEKTPYKFEKDILAVRDNTYISGYWQSPKYFSEYREDLLKIFTPQYSQARAALDYIKRVTSCNSVAIHIRLGDYQKLGNCLELSFYRKAIEFIQTSTSNPVFFIFSDDILEAKRILQNIDGKFIFVSYDSENLTLDDFFIMRSCKHQIIANSSYSWWAAWANENPEKIVICPEKGEWSGDFYPESWIKISCQ